MSVKPSGRTRLLHREALVLRAVLRRAPVLVDEHRRLRELPPGPPGPLGLLVVVVVERALKRPFITFYHKFTKKGSENGVNN